MGSVKHSPSDVVEGLRRMVAEEMFLLGQEGEDQLDGRGQRRLSQLTGSLDEADGVLSVRRRVR